MPHLSNDPSLHRVLFPSLFVPALPAFFLRKGILKRLSIFALSASLCFGWSDLFAQCPVDQTFSRVMFVAGTDTVRGDQLFPYWRFAMTYDSSQVQYEITEFEYDHVRIRLESWCSGQTLEAEAAELGDSTITDDFVVSTGDTVSFYRELLWTAPYQGGPSNGFYYALDTLDFTVEMIDFSTGMRLALLDSIGALREVPSGYPDFYGTHPIMAVIKYRVPSAFNGKSVYLRVRPHVRGNGQFKTLRVDNFATRASINLNDQFFIDYVNAFGGGSGAKHTVKYLERVENLNDALHASSASGTGTIAIAYDGLPSIEGNVKLSLFNAMGEQVFLFSSSHPAAEPLQTFYEVDESGVYFVVLSYDGNPISSVKIIADK